MSPESKARIQRLAMHLLLEGSAKRGGHAEEALRYAETIVESVVEEEVQKRLSEAQPG